MLQAGLTVVHSILLHVHERGVRISLAVAVALAKYLQMPVVLIKLREALLLYLAYSLAELLVRHALLVHLLKDAVRTLLKRLMVLKSGRLIPLSHMKNTFSSSNVAMRRPE